MKNTIILILLSLSYSIFAQDTLQVMQYNLLNYGNYWNDCTTSTNNVNTKNVHLKTIIKYVNPDIFTVNELSENTSYHQMILNQVLNTDGVNKYRKAVSFNYANSYLVNMLYYNHEKLTLYSQDVVRSAVRDIDVFTLYYNSAGLGQGSDTIFVTCFVAHLKAGNSDYDASSRASMVSTAMTYIRTHDLPENMLFMGDLNVYTHNEQAYINLLYNYSGKQYFYDPIDRPGDWNNNYSFKDIHTQSTHSQNTACFSYGGMDDRFDFILASSPLLQGNNGMKLLVNTYEALGNDGQHYNKSINSSPTNTSAPSSVINALYNMSDHLPVLSKLKVDATLGVEENLSLISSLRFKNPCNGDMQLNIQMRTAQNINIEIYNSFGQMVMLQEHKEMGVSLSISLSLGHLSDGMYVMQVSDNKNSILSRKFILKK